MLVIKAAGCVKVSELVTGGWQVGGGRGSPPVPLRISKIIVSIYNLLVARGRLLAVYISMYVYM